MKVKCPTCEKEVEWTPKNTFRPFCCERCKLIDLGEWASGERSIAGEPDWSETDWPSDSESSNDPTLH